MEEDEDKKPRDNKAHDPFWIDMWEHEEDEDDLK